MPIVTRQEVHLLLKAFEDLEGVEANERCPLLPDGLISCLVQSRLGASSNLRMPDLHSLPEGWHPEKAIRNNGPENLVLERYKLRELAEGWPCYRDACEWENLLSIFHPSA